MCRERLAPLASHRGCPGSSPRVQGTLPYPSSAAIAERIIPACAGNAWDTPPRWCSRTDHPRVCRERGHWAAAGGRIAGSSPRVQGTLNPLTQINNRWRIIPACAGNAAPTVSAICLSADHPRVCRERLPAGSEGAESIGSSPRVQGTLFEFCPPFARARIIPACAGNAEFSDGSTCVGSDHPRVCRERRVQRRIYVCGFGSSPRVQGTLVGLIAA